MAPTFVFAIAGHLLGKLSSPIIEELSLAWGMKDDLRRLENTISSVHSVLLDAQERQSSSHQLKNWLEKLEDALYRAEDVLEEFEINVLRYRVSTWSILRKVRHGLSRPNRIVFRFKMAHKIKKIREEFDEIAADRNRFNLIERSDERVVVYREATHSYVRDEDVIGRDEEKEAVVSFLMTTADYECVPVLPIIGLGGIGKTTLAKLVYNDERVVGQFDLRIWVCISEEFELEKMIKEILKCAYVIDCENLRLEQLQQRLREKLAGQKYLLILDDIWNENRAKWIDLKNLLADGASGSRIIITTRNQSVASIMATSKNRIEIQGLSHQESLSLFSKWAFSSSEDASKYSRLNEITEVIVEKCKGVPLAIRTLGSLLYTKREERDWINVRDNDIWKIEQNKDDIMPALRLSYYQLPIHLRRCFAFCSIFPKDHELDAERLTMYWQANGMLKKLDNNQEIEDVAAMYIDQLLSRGFLEEFEDYGLCPTFKMHDLVHDLALQVSQRDCINWNSQGFPDCFSARILRHVSFQRDYFSEKEVPNWLLGQKINIHTIAFPLGMGASNVSFVKTCISKFRSLRMLDLSKSDFEVLPSSIGGLKHLKYLDLCNCTQLKSIPASVCELVGLEVLLFRGCLNIEKLPRGIGKLIRLRHLGITTKESYLPESEIQCLTSLQILSISNCPNLESVKSDDTMKCLSALRLLFIQACGRLVSLPLRGLKHLTRLEKLVIYDCDNLNLISSDTSDIDGETSYAGAEECLRSLHTLMFWKLPELEIFPLWLFRGANNLKHIEITDCENLTSLNPEEMVKRFKSLRKIMICECPKLEAIPGGTLCLIAPEEVEIEECLELT